jgi:hypothetical protein
MKITPGTATNAKNTNKLEKPFRYTKFQKSSSSI